MAAPITHIVLTDKVFDKFFQDKKRKDFYIGTVFPDIRYIAGIDREITHFSLEKVSIKNIKGEQNSFIAGLKFHTLTDEVRKKFIREKEVRSLTPDLESAVKSLKLLEDELYYEHINKWNEVIRYFDDIIEDEKKLNIKEEKIREWHNILQQYFSKKPDNEIGKWIGFKLGASEKLQNEIIAIKDKIRTKEKIIKFISDFYNNFESFLK